MSYNELKSFMLLQVYNSIDDFYFNFESES